MRIYELTFILSPSLDKDATNAEIDKLIDQIKAGGGSILEVQHLGMRRFTFEMKKFWQGNYFTIYYQGAAQILANLEKGMKLNESLLRYMAIVLKPSEYAAPSSKVMTDDDFKNDNEDDAVDGEEFEG